MLYEKDLDRLGNVESSAGVLEKWYDSKNKLFIKSSSLINKLKNEYHIETVMECLAYDIGKLLNINVVKYWLDKLQTIDGRIVPVCVCRDYLTDIKFNSKINGYRLLERANIDMKNRKLRYETILEYFPELRNDLDKMIIFDYVIDNYDRHLRNFEIVLTDNKQVKLSPLFDNGSSLLSDWSDEDLEDLSDDDTMLEEYLVNAETTSKCFSHQHNTELSLIDKSALININLNIGSEDIRMIVEKYNKYLSPIRIDMIQRLLNFRLRNLKMRVK